MVTLDIKKDPDFAYGILLIVISGMTEKVERIHHFPLEIAFLLIFLVTGIFQQRITDIIAFFVSAVMLTIYVVVHYIIRAHEGGDKPIEARLRLVSSMKTSALKKCAFLAHWKVRLIFAGAFNIFFIPFSIYVIRDYQRNDFSIRFVEKFNRPLKDEL